MNTSVKSMLGCILALCAGFIHAQPHIAVRGKPSIEFGNIYQGSAPVSVVTIVNEGVDTLIIEHVDVPCHCTTTSIEKKIIAPNDSSRLRITLNSKDYIDSVRKYVLIVSNDYERRNLFVNLSANVLSLVRITPMPVSLGEVKVGEHVTRVIGVSNAGHDTIHIANVTVPENEFRISSFPAVLVPGEDTSFTLNFIASEERIYSEQVEIWIDNALQPRAYFWVTAHGIAAAVTRKK